MLRRRTLICYANLFCYLSALNVKSVIGDDDVNDDVIIDRKDDYVITNCSNIRADGIKRRSVQASFYDPCGTNRPINDDRYTIGTDDFCELVLSNDAFVDKSLLISEFLNLELYIPIVKRPRGWGKTVNTNMIKRFVELNLDGNGNVISNEDNINRKLFLGGDIELPTKGRKLLKPLKIAAHVDLIEYYFGRYPVIYVSFEEAIADDYEQIRSKFRRIISNVYRRYRYLLDGLTDEKQIERFNNYLNSNQDNITIEHLQESVYYLSELLYKRYNQYVYVFVDDYNAPMNNLYLKLVGDRCAEVKHSPTFSEPLEFFRNFFRHSMRFNEYMMQGFVSGVSHVPHMYMYLKGDIFPEYTLQDEPFSRHYGFDQNELNQLLIRMPFAVNEAALKSWYCGYQSFNGLLCNPWSVTHALRNRGRFEPYWLADRIKETTLFDEHLLSAWFQKDLQKIVSGEKVYSRITKPYDFHRYGRFAHFLSILVFHGYITPNGTSGGTVKFRVPNDELRLFYESKFRLTIERKFDFNRTNEYVDLLLGGRIEEFRVKFKNAMREIVADPQAQGNGRERLYQSILISLLKSPDCKIRSADTVRDRRTALSDKPCLVVEPINDDCLYTNASLIAVRMVTRKKLVFRTLRDSLNELDENYYWQQSKIRQFERLIKLSFAFTGLDFHTRQEIVNPRIQRRNRDKNHRKKPSVNNVDDLTSGLTNVTT